MAAKKLCFSSIYDSAAGASNVLQVVVVFQLCEG